MIITTEKALEQLSLVLSSSKNSLVKEEDRTLVLYERSITTMQTQIRELAVQNRTLCTALVTVESQHREKEFLSAAEITALQEKVKTSEAAVKAIRKEMQATTQKAHKMVQDALVAKEAAVKVATELADARVAAARQETETQMKGQRAELLRQICSAADGQVNEILSVLDANTKVQQQSSGTGYLHYAYVECALATRYRSLKGFADWLKGLK